MRINEGLQFCRFSASWTALLDWDGLDRVRDCLISGVFPDLRSRSVSNPLVQLPGVPKTQIVWLH
jgi:hypothetical protein